MKSRLREREVKLWVHEDVADGGVMQRGSELQLPQGCEARGNELHSASTGLFKTS